MEDCVILFLHHKNDLITKQHLSLLEFYNPYFKVVPLTPDSHPRSNLWSYGNMWMHNDTMIYNWIDSSDFIKAKRYCWFDWDTLCQQPVDEYYGASWNADMAGTNLFDKLNNPSWWWFEHAKKHKTLSQYFDIMKGLVPFCGIIASNDALEHSIKHMKKEFILWREQMNELRLPTCAHLCGIKVSQIDRNSIQPFKTNIGNNGKIIHPIKTHPNA